MIARRTLLGSAGLALAAPALAQAPVLKVGSTPTGIPFTFLDTRTNKLTGFMVDLITAIGRDQGFGVEVQATPFAALIASLTTNRIDVIAAAMLATPARREQISFSNPVYGYGEGLAVRGDGGATWTSLTEMRGVTAGAQIGTVYIEPLKAAGLEVKTYDSVADIMRDVSLGRIQAGFGDAPIVAYQIAQGTFRGVRLAREYKPSIVGSIALGARKGDAVMGKLNEGLANAKASGAFAALIAKWNLPASIDA